MAARGSAPFCLILIDIPALPQHVAAQQRFQRQSQWSTRSVLLLKPVRSRRSVRGGPALADIRHLASFSSAPVRSGSGCRVDFALVAFIDRITFLQAFCFVADSGFVGKASRSVQLNVFAAATGSGRTASVGAREPAGDRVSRGEPHRTSLRGSVASRSLNYLIMLNPVGTVKRKFTLTLAHHPKS